MNHNDVFSKRLDIISVGPVVGLVTHNSANILLETNFDIRNMRCILVNNSEIRRSVFELPTSNHIMTFRANVPKLITLTNLPECSSLEFLIVDQRVSNRDKSSASFHTFKKCPKSFNLICLSETGHSDGQSLLRTVSEKVSSSHIDLVLHSGGQINLKNIINDFLNNAESVRLANQLSPESCTAYIEELFRDCYRKCWNNEDMKVILSSCQNIMMWNASDSLIDYDQSKWKSLVRHNICLMKCARKVYCEYQCLTYNKSYCNWGRYGLFLFDSHNQCYKKQFEDLESFLSSESDILILSSNYPFVDVLNKQMEAWPCKYKILYLMFRYIERWQRMNKNKKVVLLSGCDSNTKCGMKTNIDNLGYNTTTSQITFGPLSQSTAINNDMQDYDMKYKRYNISQKILPENNFGVIKFFVHDGKHSVGIETVTKEKPYQQVDYTIPNVSGIEKDVEPEADIDRDSIDLVKLNPTKTIIEVDEVPAKITDTESSNILNVKEYKLDSIKPELVQPEPVKSDSIKPDTISYELPSTPKVPISVSSVNTVTNRDANSFMTDMPSTPKASDMDESFFSTESSKKQQPDVLSPDAFNKILDELSEKQTVSAETESKPIKQDTTSSPHFEQFNRKLDDIINELQKNGVPKITKPVIKKPEVVKSPEVSKPSIKELISDQSSEAPQFKTTNQYVLT